MEHTMEHKIDQLVANTQNALKAMADFTQEQVDRIVEAMVGEGIEHATELGEMAYEETGMGVVEHKIAKNMSATQLMGDFLRGKKSVGVIKEENGITEIAEPFGVIAGVTPTTNPTSTVMFKAIIALKGRNTIVFAFHPRAQKSGAKAAQIMLDAAVAAGAPENCIQWITEPSIEATNYLLKHQGVSLIVATGGPALVKASYSSGNPAYGVGAGNVPAYIEKSADIKKTVETLIMSKTFDNGIICASENNLIFDDAEFAKEVMAEFEAQGAYILREDQTDKLVETLFDLEKGVPNIDVIGKPAKVVAELAGFDVPENTKVLLTPLKTVGAGDKLSGEKLTPILGFYVAEGRDAAIQTACNMLEYKGAGHTASIHTTDDSAFEAYAVAVPANRILLNQPSVLGAVGGEFNNLNPTFTLGCGTQGGNSIDENLQYNHLLNIKRAARPKK